ncbi:hypothetical protein [Kribbella sp. NPDC051718]|uniref:hypothetical protein n=1 Tax=Kribbella sp. NPDC051718 TaxID=3155168 RepID=UPI0034272D2F
MERAQDSDTRTADEARSRPDSAEPQVTDSPGNQALAAAAPSGMSVGQIVAMQQQAGNTAVTQLMAQRPGAPQPAITVPGPQPGTGVVGNQPAGGGGAGAQGAGDAPAALAGGPQPVVTVPGVQPGTGVVGNQPIGGGGAGAQGVVGGAGVQPGAGVVGSQLAGGEGAGAQGAVAAAGVQDGGGQAAGAQGAGEVGVEGVVVEDGQLISGELAEHERWALGFGAMGTAGSDDRARFLLEMTGQGAASGAAGGLVSGFAMSAVGAAVTQVAVKRLTTMAVARGATATPIPGLGPAIGGVMALAGLASRDWKSTGQTIDKIGQGTGYEGLANNLEGLAEILDVALAVMDVVGGVLGGIAVGMWVASVLSAGVLSPLALSLSTIATGLGFASTAVGLIINTIIRPVITALRALHAFESQGDPAQVEQQGQALSGAAGQVAGALAGALAAKVGAKVGESAGNRIDRGITRIQERATGGAPNPSALGAAGPSLHAEMPDTPEQAPDTVPEGGKGTAPPSSEAIDTVPVPTPDPDTLPLPKPVDTSPDTHPTPTPTDLAPDTHPTPGPGDAAPDTLRSAGGDPVPEVSAPHPVGEVPDPAALQKVKADLEIVGDFSDESMNVLDRRNRGDAEAGDIGRHRHQGARGDALISEHVIPGAQLRDASTDPATGVPDWKRKTPGGSDASDYRGATTIAEHAAVAEHKTRLDNQATIDLKASGGPQNMVDDLLIPSLDRHQQAVDTAIAQGQIQPGQATDPTHRALAAQAEMWGAGKNNPPADVAGHNEYDWDATFNAQPAPTPSAPGFDGTTTQPMQAVHAPATAQTGPPAMTRPDAMAQYKTQVAANPHLESGVWRDANGDFFTIQGNEGSVGRPPNAKPPLELIYHSHPISPNPAQQNLNTQPSQAGGDFGVVQGQHAADPVGKRQTSELHFPVYDQNGRHVGYGATTFTYDPTNPLPLQVTTSAPGRETTTQRYKTFADFQQRAQVGVSGQTPHDRAANFNYTEGRLAADRAGAQQAIDARVGKTDRKVGYAGVAGIREGRDLGRRLLNGAGAGGRPGTPYTAAVGLRPGESVDVPINPLYPAPPGTKAEIAALRERIALDRDAQADLSQTESQMAAQAETQRKHDEQLGQAGQTAQKLVTGGQAQAAATAQTQTTNQQQQSTAGGAIDTLGKTAREAGAVTTLVGSLYGFQGLANLFGYLPGDLGVKATNASKDVTKLIASLNRVRNTEEMAGQLEGRKQGVKADEQRIGAVAQQNQQTAAELDQGTQQVADLKQRNQDRLAETEATKDQSQKERQAAVDDEAGAQAKHDDLEARMQEWAVAHQEARQQAITAARARLMAQGYKVQEKQ